MRRTTMIVTAATWLLATGGAAAQDSPRYERVRVPGPALEGNLGGNEAVRDVSIYLPPGYDEDETRRYPVVYMLHGFTSTDEAFFNAEGTVDLAGAADKAWAAGAAEMILVVPNAYTRFAGSMYSSSVTTGDWEAFIAEDLVAYVDSHYRTLPQRASRGLAGHSMGGYGALRIGMKYPDVFAALYAMSPCCMAANMNPSPERFETVAAVRTQEEVDAAGFGVKAMLASAAAWSPNPENPPMYFDLPVADGEVRQDVVAKWAANAPLTFVHQYVPELARYAAIHLDAGDMDVPIIDTVHELAAVLDTYGIEHVAEEYAGDHVNRIHERIETKVLPMFSKRLALE